MPGQGHECKDARTDGVPVENPHRRSRGEIGEEREREPPVRIDRQSTDEVAERRPEEYWQRGTGPPKTPSQAARHSGMEGRFESGPRAGLVLIGQPNAALQRLDNSIASVWPMTPPANLENRAQFVPN